VIRRLDAVPGAQQEADGSASGGTTRDVATQLRPPVLQDLGLVAAIEDRRDQLISGRAGWVIDIAINDAAGDRRPPADVELAALRHAGSRRNALTHSDGRNLTIRGAAAAGAIDLTVTDDGRDPTR
jgi:signal transduction histidine kinase